MTLFALQQYSVSSLLNAQMHLVQQSIYCSLHARVAGRGKTDGLRALLKCFCRSNLLKKIKSTRGGEIPAGCPVGPF